MTFNLRYDNPADGENNWELRKAEVFEMIREINPAILGIQEGLQTQVSDLEQNLPKHKFTGVGRDDGKNSGEFSAIFFDTTKFILKLSKTYWLSDTPEKISVGWDASMERIVTVTLLQRIATQDSLWVFNTHFDHIGKKARVNSARLILELIEATTTQDCPVVVMGDLNSLPSDPPILLFSTELKDAFDCGGPESNSPEGTFNGFDTTNIANKRIDYIFTKNLNAANYKCIDKRRKNGLHLSDHFAVMCEISPKKD